MSEVQRDDNARKVGTVYLVGAGAGDAGLISVRALALVQRCDVLVYDALANPQFLQQARPDCKRLFVGKIPGSHSYKQEEINALLVEHARAGCMVVRLKGGDPFVFGRGGEEALALEANGVPYALVPGVTSAIAALESAGIPVTHRELARSFTVITGHTSGGAGVGGDASGVGGRFTPYAAIDGTLVFLMGVAHLADIAAELIAGGRPADTPVAIVEQGTTVRERRINGTLATIATVAAREKVTNPAVICVGAVARFRLTSNRLPLAKKRIAVTGTPQLVEKLVPPLQDLGALVYAAPYLRARADSAVIAALPPLSDIGWLVFTSANGVRFFFEALQARAIDYRALAAVRFCVVGAGTAATLRSYGFTADYIPDRYTVADMAQGFAARYWQCAETPARLVCVLRAAEGSPDLATAFDSAHIPYRDLPLYTLTSEPEQCRALLAQCDVLDYITFASSSGARAFFDYSAPDAPSMPPLRHECAFVCIGSKTADTVRHYCELRALPNRVLTASTYMAQGIIAALQQAAGDCV